MILEKLGRSSLPAAHAALRELAAIDPARHDQLARALADHPSDSDLSILVSALASHDRNTTNLATVALRKIKASPEGPEGLANLIRLARRSGSSSRRMLDDLASRWTGEPAPSASTSFDQALATWENVYRKRFPGAAKLSETESSARSRLRPERADRQSAPWSRDEDGLGGARAQVITRARCLDCHKFGDKGEGLGPELTTVNSRFRPAEIVESIVLPSKVISDQYKSVTLATQDGKIYGGMPIVSRRAEPCPAPARRNEGHDSQGRDRGAEGFNDLGDARGIAQPAELSRNRRSAGIVRIDAARGRAGECGGEGEVTAVPEEYPGPCH